MSNPNKIIALIPDGMKGARTLIFVLNTIASEEWEQTFYRALSAASDGETNPAVLTDSDGNAILSMTTQTRTTTSYLISTTAHLQGGALGTGTTSRLLSYSTRLTRRRL